MKKNNLIYIISLAALGFVACEPEFDQPLEDTPLPTQESGTADFSSYVALGNSLTAGFMDGALFQDGQKNSFPNLLAGQMQAAGGGAFNVPFMADNIGGFAGQETDFGTRFVLEIGADGDRTPVRANSNTAANNITAKATGGPFNNFGVPGAKSFHLGADGYGAANPYFGRMQTSETTSVIKDALARLPKFFTLWIGSNDVLSYALSGGTGVNQTGNLDASSYGSDDITDPNVLAGAIKGYLDALTSAGAKGIIANIPDISTIPFFTAVPSNALELTAEQAEALTSYFKGYAGVLTAGAAPSRVEAEVTRLVTEQVTAAVTQATLDGKTPSEIQAIQEQTQQAATAAITQPENLAMIQAQVVAGLTEFFKQYEFEFKEGKNGFIIKTEITDANPQGIKQITPSEFILLTIDQTALRTEFYGSVAATEEISAIGAKLATNPSSVTPQEALTYLDAVNAIEDKDALEASEVEEIKTATDAYNLAISQLATDNENVELYNVKSRLTQLLSGIQISGGGELTAEIASAFSLDGFHLTQQAHAVVTNDLIKIINSKYGASLQEIDPSLFSTVTLK